MKKVERINTIMRYINNRARFTITEIMREFNISRSTAIRDIREIETLGMPLVAEVGRDGGYFVMSNAVLPTVRFTDNEIKALFIAFMATRNQQLPYLKNRQSITEKLLGLISQTQQDELVLLNNILLFEGTNPHNPDLLDLSDFPHPMLEKLIQSILHNCYLLISVREQRIERTSPIYLLHLHQEKSFWFIECFDLETEERRIVPVDLITDVKLYAQRNLLSRKKILEKLNQQKEAINIVLELGPKAITQFKKYHPLKASIAYTDPYQTTAIVKTMTDAENVTEMVNWILFLGSDMELKAAPEELQKALRDRLQSLI